jgi:hypothetical protein
MPADVFILSSDTRTRILYETNGTSYYYGYGGTSYNAAHQWLNNDATWVMSLNNLGDLSVTGQFYCQLYTTTNQYPHDYVGVPFETASGAVSNYTLKLILNSFTGFHRNFTEDELFDENEPQLFKDTYEGRIVISTGKIATQIGNETNGYEIKNGKEGIFIEDSHPLIELSRKKKDKRVFGVVRNEK